MSNSEMMDAAFGDARTWFIVFSDGTEAGPFSMQQLATMAPERTLQPNDHVQNYKGLCKRCQKATSFGFLQREFDNKPDAQTIRQPVATGTAESTQSALPTISGADLALESDKANSANDSKADWFVLCNGVQSGPFTIEQLEEKASEGQIRPGTPDHSFWNNWSSMGNVHPHTGKVGTRLPSVRR